MTNNDILKKLRVALQLRDEEIAEIMQLVDFRISKSELGAFFRAEDHPNYVECGDQILRNFLNGLVIHLRGTKENPKNPKEVLAQKKTVPVEKRTENRTQKTDSREKKIDASKNTEKKSVSSKKAPKKFPSNRDTRNPILGQVKFNNGKKKKD